MKESLPTYVHDHLAGASFAVELLQHLQESHAKDELGHLAGRVLWEVVADRHERETVCNRFSPHESTVKNFGAWLFEKAAKLKLRANAQDDFGDFQALEILTLGIFGKLQLWKALKRVGRNEPRLCTLDYEHLIDRAQSQPAR